MNASYHSNGKLMISGEYMVLHGANSLVVPLKIGQHMHVNTIENTINPEISWNAFVLDEQWFNARISIIDFSIIDSSDEEIAKNLLKIIREAVKLNPQMFDSQTGYVIRTETGFDRNWGFGSSSALTSNIAQWAMIDPFELHFRTSDGSGADVAAAISNGPVLFQLINRKPHYCKVNFAPSFMDRLWLVYTGKKQHTSTSIRHFNTTAQLSDKALRRIDEITLEMTSAGSLKDFLRLMFEHEKCLSEVWGIPMLKEQFSNFSGEMKSLGAWGGDFIMAASDNEEVSIKEYFSERNMQVLFSLDQIILQ